MKTGESCRANDQQTNQQAVFLSNYSEDLSGELVGWLEVLRENQKRAARLTQFDRTNSRHYEFIPVNETYAWEDHKCGERGR